MQSSDKPIRQLTYQDINRQAINIATQLVSSNFKPRLIIPIVRGGVIPAAILYSGICRYWQKSADCELMSIWASSYEGQSQKQLKVDIPSHVRAQIHKGGNVLFVDDIYDTGDTISMLNYNLRDARRKADIRIATFLTKDENGPDFFGELLTNKTEWIGFPWED